MGVTSDIGLRFIANEEGFCSHAYKDTAGYETIGWGHRIMPGESWPNGISHDEAIALKKRDLVRFEAVVSKLTPAPEQNQFDALVSLAYNIGAAALAASSVRKRWPGPDTADAFLIWCMARDGAQGPVVVNAVLAGRRWRERSLFLGSTESTWKDYQQALWRLGFYKGAIDGRVGPLTLGAVSKLREYVSKGGAV